MNAFSFLQPKNLLTVSQLTHYLRQVLESDENLQDLWVQGEISNLAKPSSGHLYFTLKDTDAAIRCVMWRSAAGGLPFEPKEGIAVEAHGSMSIYEVSGQVQFYVDTLQTAGEGSLYQAYLRLKAKLEAEGLFDPEKKQTLPARPKRIGIVTSPTGAALQDMLNTIQRRFPIAEIILSPTTVQGTEAPPAIVRALNLLIEQAAPDVILIGRGGGSIEDLWAFNNEEVVRAVAACPIPIVSGVGHETDFTLTDFAADLRAPTPTAAAEVATPDKQELQGLILEMSSRHTTLLREMLAESRHRLKDIKSQYQLLSPAFRINAMKQNLDEHTYRLSQRIQTHLEQTQLKLESLTHALNHLNPKSILERGYAIVTRKDDHQIIKRADQVQPADLVLIQVSQGSMEAQITKKKQELKDERSSN